MKSIVYSVVNYVKSSSHLPCVVLVFYYSIYNATFWDFARLYILFVYIYCTCTAWLFLGQANAGLRLLVPACSMIDITPSFYEILKFFKSFQQCNVRHCTGLWRLCAIFRHVYVVYFRQNMNVSKDGSLVCCALEVLRNCI